MLQQYDGWEYTSANEVNLSDDCYLSNEGESRCDGSLAAVETVVGVSRYGSPLD